VPTWGEILQELEETKAAQQQQGLLGPDFDAVRRRYLSRLHDVTGRPVILYASDWLRNQTPQTGIVLGDMGGMMEVCKDVPGPDLDLIIHSPGGSPEAAASIVRYLRGKYSNIRVFVPLAAMSAATMWALASDEIVMGKHSQLGPIDPQIVTPRGAFPARALIAEFERAKSEIAEQPQTLGAWLPILQQYTPGLLQQCEMGEELAKRLVAEWLEEYMFAGRHDATALAGEAAGYFADYHRHQSHSIGIRREQCRDLQLSVLDLEEDQNLQDAVLSVYHATIHTFAGPAVKIVENHLGRAFAEMQQALQIQVPAPALPVVPQQPPQPSPPASPAS
jgi:hypothetical protein